MAVRDDQDAPRRRLVETGLDAVRDLSVEALLGAVGIREIARRAGVTPRAIYHHYGTLAGLADAVLARVYDPGPGLGPLPAGPETPEAARSADLAGVYRFYERTLASLAADRFFRLRVGLWAVGDEQAREAYRAHVTTLEARLLEQGTLILGHGVREPRPPFDAAGVTAAMSALLHGCALYHQLDPRPAHLSAFTRTCVALGTVITRPVGDRQDVIARLSEINYYPVEVARGRTHLGDIRQRTHAHAVRTATELFTRDGYEATTLEQVADAAGLAPHTVRRLGLDKHTLAVEAFRWAATRHADVAEPAPEDAFERLHAEVVALVVVARRHRDLVPAYLAETLRQPQDDAVLEPLSRALAGIGRPPEDAVPLLLGVVRHALGRPAHTPEEIATRTLQRLLARIVRTADAAQTGSGASG